MERVTPRNTPFQAGRAPLHAAGILLLVLMGCMTAGCEANRYRLQTGTEWKQQREGHSQWADRKSLRKSSRYESDMARLQELIQQEQWELADQLSLSILYSTPAEWDTREARRLGHLAREKLAENETPKIGVRRSFDLGAGVTMDFVWCPPTHSWQWRLLSNGEMRAPLVLSTPPTGKSSLGTRNSGATGRMHTQDLMAGFWISRTEVTQAQWNRLMEVNPSLQRHDEYPVFNVSFWEAGQFADRLSARFPSNEFRIPTALEWDYACRAGRQVDEDVRRTMWPVVEAEGAGERSEAPENPDGPRRVGLGSPNAWGLFDMIGNVQEWNREWRAVSNNPFAASALFLSRGGSWKSTPQQRWLSPHRRQPHVGFRLVCQPADLGPRYKPALLLPPGDKLAMTAYVVRDGDTLEALAQQNKLNPRTLREANDWPETKTTIRPGELLWIPPPLWQKTNAALPPAANSGR